MANKQRDGGKEQLWRDVLRRRAPSESVPRSQGARCVKQTGMFKF